MKRNFTDNIRKDLKSKMVILSGPRQCGKTYLAKHISPETTEYLNYDVANDRKKILKTDWPISSEILILDELHKMKKWKNWLKGVVDAGDSGPQILVTGSAKLETYKKVGDSLAGRYFSYRLHPLDIKEIYQLASLNLTEEKILERLLTVSGFPEPFLKGELSFYNRWQQTHLDVILKQDVLETESVKSIKQIETLALLLTERVGSTLSYNSLREDLSTDDKSIKRWTDLLENSFVLFRLYPYIHKNIIGGLKKAPKVYFYDYCRVDNSAARLENLVACALLKEIHYRRDVDGEKFELHFLRNKSDIEIDFLITKNKKPHLMIEVKEGDDKASNNFKVFDKYFDNIKKVQLVKNLKKKFITKNNIHIEPLAKWLVEMDF